MTIQNFFLQTASHGLGKALDSLAQLNQETQLLESRLDNLKKVLMLGIISTEDAVMERNRIAYEILALIEKEELNPVTEKEIAGKISNALREHLDISEQEEAYALAVAKEGHKRVAETRAKIQVAMKEEDLSPMPKAELLDAHGIRQLLAEGHTDLAIRHLLSLCEDESFFSKADMLAAHYKTLQIETKSQRIPYSELTVKLNRITYSVLGLLSEMEKKEVLPKIDIETVPPGLPKHGWWKRLWS